jgi:hypothetical protein
MGASPVTDSVTYRSKHWITPNDFNLDGNINDTLIGIHNFYNYYSFDDGTAEAGYGLNTYGAMMAVKIQLNQLDTIKAVDIYFNPILSVGLIQNSSYRVAIWSDNGGVPSTNPIYKDSLIYPDYLTNANTNAFQRDTLTSPVPLSGGTVYYVGIIQTSNQPLNIGFDRNYNHKDRMFYNATGNWANSSFDGSYMIRPIMRKLDLFSGIKTEIKEPLNVVVFPNPAKTNITINHSGIKTGQYVNAELYDVAGRLILVEKILNNQSIDISNVTNGIYLLRVNNGEEILHTSKLFISH